VYGVALGFQVRAGFQYGLVLGGEGDDFFALFECQTFQRSIDGFRSARGENDLPMA
jgi:hypothetical protein